MPIFFYLGKEFYIYIYMYNFENNICIRFAQKFDET